MYVLTIKGRRGAVPKKAKRKYSRSSGTEVENEMRRHKRGTAKSDNVPNLSHFRE